MSKKEVVYLNGAQFDLETKFFMEVVEKIAQEREDIPILCSCGVCTVDKGGAEEIAELIRKASQGMHAIKKIRDDVNRETININMAACGRSRVVERTEDCLRQS